MMKFNSSSGFRSRKLLKFPDMGIEMPELFLFSCFLVWLKFDFCG